MKHILLYICLLSTLAQCKSQETKLLSKTQITDFSDFPFYKHVTTTNGDEVIWKEQYAFIDSVNVYGITYLSDGLKVKGFIIEPKTIKKYPAIIYNRGGNRDFGAISTSMAALFLGKLAWEGYVVIASQYRGNMGGEGVEEFGGADISDVLSLIPILENMENVDASKIGMYGWSRGGMMTYSSLAKTKKIKAAVVGGAVSDMNANITDRPTMETGVLQELIPNYEKNKKEELRKRSAVLWADKFPKNVPILMLHGNADWRVKPEQSLLMALEFEKYRIPYRLVMFEGGDHGISEHRTEVDAQVLDWFDKYLKKGQGLPDMEYHGQ